MYEQSLYKVWILMNEKYWSYRHPKSITDGRMNEVEPLPDLRFAK